MQRVRAADNDVGESSNPPLSRRLHEFGMVRQALKLLKNIKTSSSEEREATTTILFIAFHFSSITITFVAPDYRHPPPPQQQQFLEETFFRYSRHFPGFRLRISPSIPRIKNDKMIPWVAMCRHA